MSKPFAYRAAIRVPATVLFDVLTGRHPASGLGVGATLNPVPPDAQLEHAYYDHESLCVVFVATAPGFQGEATYLHCEGDELPRRFLGRCRPKEEAR